MVRTVKLMADYYAHVLWEVGDDRVGDIDPKTFLISEGLRNDLHAWGETYFRTLNQQYPPDSGFTSPEEEVAFDREGRRLWAELRSQLGTAFRVVYFSNLDAKIYE